MAMRKISYPYYLEVQDADGKRDFVPAQEVMHSKELQDRVIDKGGLRAVMQAKLRLAGLLP